VRAYLELIRPGNVATALADVLAGFAVAGLANPRALPWLLAATACLYAGGITLNDVFDRHLDAHERPERPIPSGRVPPRAATWLGTLLLATGVAAARVASQEAMVVAALICSSVLIYDSWGKHWMFLGPINMGLCRALNLILGMAAVPAVIPANWPLACIALTYIAAVTALSRGEVGGGKRPVAIVALVLLGLVVLALLGLSIGIGPAQLGTLWGALKQGGSVGSGLSSLHPFGVLLSAFLAWRVLPPFWRALASPGPATIRVAVRTGVLSLVLVDAVIAAAYAGMIYSLAVLTTALLAAWLARRFAVT
jgi:4-hydroxybenzoate polyprenyltransferase